MAKPLQWEARHTILAVVFCACIVSFMDRMAMSVAIPYIAADYHLAPTAMGLVLSIFFASYALSQIPGGLLADRFGARRVGTIALLWWSAFTAVTGAAANLTQMLFARLSFGFGEGVFPTCAFKAVAEWFPKSERATANAVMLASGSIGAALAPPIVVAIVSHWGWRWAFWALSAPGLVTAIVFWTLVRDKPLASADPQAAPGTAEVTQAPGSKARLSDVFRQPSIWGFILAYFFFDVAYWGLTNWLPTYLVRARGFSMLQMGMTAAVPQIAGVAGSLVGGWASDRYFSGNRKVPIIAAQLISALFLYLTFKATSASMVVAYQIGAGFFLNAFFTAFWAVPMTTVPVAQIGVTTGAINTAGQTAAFLSPVAVGFLVGASNGAFDLTFALFIVSLLLSCAVVVAMPLARGARPLKAPGVI